MNGKGRQGRLMHKVAIVTGGASGIGRATWRRFVAEGASVVVADRDGSIEEAVASHQPAALFVRHDVRCRESWNRLIETTRRQFGRLDVLVNSAGILREGTIENTELAEWRAVMDVNLSGVFFGCQAAIPLMRLSESASIVNISSVSGLKGDAELIAYDASKGGVSGLTKDIALYLARRGEPIRCNSVHPGVVTTNMVHRFFETAKLSTREDWMSAQPNGRVIAPEEVAGMILFLASDESRFVNGSEFVIDGGMMA